MQINHCIACRNFPCPDVDHAAYQVPAIDLDPQRVRLVLISEAAPPDPANDYYRGESASYAQTSLLAFQEAGAPVGTFQEMLEMGVYLTNAVKCAKTAYGIETSSVLECSKLLEQELALFPNLQAYLLMGDVAIKALNAIAKRQGQARPVPAGATYKIRGGDFRYLGRPVFPSYLQVGPSFGIEKSKRKMIAEDIAAALRII